ncbi:MAG: class I SAM-dependent methyltransferase [Acidobacteriota bacterium]
MPAHSVMLHHSRKEALEYPRGDMRLGFCEGCGFISNTAFDVQLNEYDSRYEETQGFSPTFKRFNQGVAEALISRYELQGKTVLEIGCGKGEFLALLCEMGVGRGIGFDPAFIPDRLHSDASDRLTFFKELYSEKHSHVAADFICCKMTLEHISDTAAMIQTVRRSIGDRRTPVFFQIPNAEYVLDDLAFWDVYYEHCSYFTAGSLRRLFQSCGFRVLDVRVEYGSQYLTIDAVPDDAAVAPPAQAEEDLADLQSAVQRFAKQVPARIADWQSKLRQFHSANSRVVLWGGGSKAVAFLNALDIQDEVKYAVDVNPFKTGTFLAGTGQEVVAPEFLNEYRPDVIVLMNPIYKSEVETSLKAMGVQAELLTV